MKKKHFLPVFAIFFPLAALLVERFLPVFVFLWSAKMLSMLAFVPVFADDADILFFLRLAGCLRSFFSIFMFLI